MATPGAQQRAATKFIVFENFEKMNTQSVRQALSEKELAWLENLQPIAGNNLTTIPAASSTPLAAIAESIVSFFPTFINGTDYFIAFTTAGAGYAINIATGAVNNFAPDGTFSQAPDVTTWQASRVLINDSVAGYSTFDGTLFVKQGNVSPVFVITNGGSGYSTAPPVTISGGSGTGATAHAVISQGVVIAVVLDNPGTGYNAGDVLTVTFGTGVGSGATGHVTMTGFNVASLAINNQGSFPSPAAGVHALTFTGGGGTGAAGTATVATVGLGNKVVSLTLTAGGSGYTTSPTVTLSTSGGTAPVLSAALGTEAVATIVLDAGGSLYVAPPNVSIQGGSPAVAATAHSTISAGAVNALVLDTPGSGYTSTPIVVIGTGSGAAATGHVWPFVPKGATLAVFQGRVWLSGLANGVNTLLQYTGTQGFDDFNSANAAGSLIISDSDLIHAITALRSYNNYLYIMGDQSVKQIGNISLNSVGNVTLFSILTLSSDQGTIYPKSCISYNRVFMFANSNGIYGVFGSSVQKLSDDMDGIFKLIDFSQPPQGALADINNIHNAVFLVRYADPLSSTRSIMLTFTGKKWFLISQGDSLKAIATTAALVTGKNSLYGSSGTDVTNLLANPAGAVTFKWQTSLTHHGNAVQRKKTIRQGYAVTAGGSGNITFAIETEEGSQSSSRAIVAGFQAYTFSNPNVSGRYLGMTITGTLAGFTGSALTVEYQEINVGNKN